MPLLVSSVYFKGIASFNFIGFRLTNLGLSTLNIESYLEKKLFRKVISRYDKNDMKAQKTLV